MRKINVITMAGSGQRFLDQKYLTPKPLIIIKKKPMFYYAAKSLPLSQNFIFICQKKLNLIYKFKLFVKKFFNNSKIIEIPKKTNGQATTCKLASKYLRNDDIVTYGSCDYFYSFNRKQFDQLINSNDLVLFVHKPQKINIVNFKEYGWVKKGKENTIQKIKCKNKVSQNPKNDFVIAGTFTFKNKKIFHHSYREMINKIDKINNEFYMDTVAKHAVLLKYKVKYIMVKNFKSYGTPGELKKNV
jgi:NDP-sugar pyrophosphorylase family protein